MFLFTPFSDHFDAMPHTILSFPPVTHDYYPALALQFAKRTKKFNRNNFEDTQTNFEKNTQNAHAVRCSYDTQTNLDLEISLPKTKFPPNSNLECELTHFTGMSNTH